FERKGLIIFGDDIDEETVTMIALEHGAEDVAADDDGKLTVTCAPEDYESLAAAFAEAELPMDVNEVTQIASTNVDVDESMAKRVMSLLEALDDHDDVQTVATNVNFPESVASGES
ncbi:MAG: YebC/PmpR family DNA-binding transcriptional regulator, partial [Planctomycetota bacterium]